MTTNGPLAWTLAARPKTLAGAEAPVAVGVAWARLTAGFTLWTPAVLCLLFAVLMQVTANFVNDYVDFLHHRDNAGRLGPRRACSQGWITPRAMRRGLIVTSALACLCGLPLVLWGGWAMIGIGAACLLFCYLYSTVLSGFALGDVLVLLFFGVVPVCVTFYLQAGVVTAGCALCSVAMGLATDALLVVNNYRDLEQDASVGKRTLAVVIGKRSTLALHLLTGGAAFCLALWAVASEGKGWQCLLLLPYLAAHAGIHGCVRHTGQGAALNKALGMTGACILLFALGLSLAAIL